MLFRAYLLEPDGHFLKRIDIDVPDEAAALTDAKKLVDGHDVELWYEGRMIAHLRRDEERGER